MFTVGDSYLADSADEIADALNRYTANDENDMATYYNKDDGVSEKLTSAVWSVEMRSDRLFGRIDCSLTYGRGNGVSPGLAYGTVLRRSL